MSRIHEALKRAEEQKARHAPDSSARVPVDDSMAPAAHEVGGEGIAPERVADSFRDGLGPLSREALKSQVKRVSWNPHPTTMLFFGKQTYAPGTEEFRTLRSNLYSLGESKPLRTVLITSSIPGEGKSFIAANLAQILVQQPDKYVLLIDADLRWSRLHQSLGTNPEPGLAEYIRGEADELAVMQRGPLENLFFIPGGKHPPDPAELIASRRLPELLEQMAPLFDWVIVDSPPAMAVSDAKVMADYCDGVLLVIGAGRTAYPLAQKTRQQFKNHRVLGVVLNRAEPRMSYSYKYYGYYKGPEDHGGNSKHRS